MKGDYNSMRLRMKDACLAGDVEEVAACLDAGFSPNWCLDEMTYPLQLAAIHGKTEACALLLQRGARIDQQAYDHRTALDMVRNGPVESAIFLIDAGACISDRNVDSLLELSIDSRSAQLLERLLSNKLRPAELEQQPTPVFHRIAHLGSREMAEVAVRHGVDVNCRDLFGASAVHGLVSRHSMERLEWLQELGADINARDERGRTVLHCLAQGTGNEDLVAEVVRMGADAQAKDDDGNTILEVEAVSTFGPGSIVATFLAKAACFDDALEELKEALVRFKDKEIQRGVAQQKAASREKNRPKKFADEMEDEYTYRSMKRISATPKEEDWRVTAQRNLERRLSLLPQTRLEAAVRSEKTALVVDVLNGMVEAGEDPNGIMRQFAAALERMQDLAVARSSVLASQAQARAKELQDLFDVLYRRFLAVQAVDLAQARAPAPGTAH